MRRSRTPSKLCIICEPDIDNILDSADERWSAHKLRGQGGPEPLPTGRGRTVSNMASAVPTEYQ